MFFSLRRFGLRSASSFDSLSRTYWALCVAFPPFSFRGSFKRSLEPRSLLSLVEYFFKSVSRSY